ncbi:hydroxyethylthiazole kinase, sugar kinase family [Thermanaerovibrio velox DSM 12556]|uniref:hydroxyethylthiazole kinase n=2 Tax=Thermanaerovibrio TaxID=81461 RepID=H0UN22_9BACT|nr:hydroxyethylthiazole kinase, sugar kinase family [Thermanaerovibrio velox DSM 12556]
MDGREIQRIAQEAARRSPLVHHVTNRVACTLQAKACYALNGRAIMTDLPSELPEASAMAQAGVINLGTPGEQSERAYDLMAKLFSAQGKPFLLDPVGCSSFEGRLRRGLSICGMGPHLVKGNYGEVISLAWRRCLEASGVDAGALGEMEPREVAKLALGLSEKLRCCVVATGRVDLVAFDGRATAITGGSPMGAAVPGLGCALGSIMACAMGAGVEPHRAAIWGCGLLKGAAIWAEAKDPDLGPEGFLGHVLDFLSLCRKRPMGDVFDCLEVVEC